MKPARSHPACCRAKPMISVIIKINGKAITGRSAVNTGETRGEATRYAVDDGTSVWHDPEQGAVPLAIKLLETIKEFRHAKHPDKR